MKLTHNQKGWLLTILIITVVLLTVWGSLSHAHAGEMDAWDFKFFGISARDFEDRHWLPVVIGGVSSVLAHEVLGHMLASEMTGMGHASFDVGDLVVYAGDGYNDASDDQKAWYSASGLIVQSLGSIILTSLPKTRHSDFTLGWNTGTTITGFNYGITGGADDDTSDVLLMEEYGWPGTEIAYGTGIIGGITTYISLDKEE